MLLNCGVGEDSWESLGLQGDPTSPSWRRSVLGVHWKGWCWSWNSNTPPHVKSWLIGKDPDAGKDWRQEEKGMTEDGWMASPTWWTWVWVNSGSWWCTGRPGVLQFMGFQRIGHNWVTELNWTELISVHGYNLQLQLKQGTFFFRLVFVIWLSFDLCLDLCFVCISK